MLALCCPPPTEAECSGALGRRPTGSSRSQIPLLCDSRSEGTEPWLWSVRATLTLGAICGGQGGGQAVRGQQARTGSGAEYDPDMMGRPGGGGDTASDQTCDRVSVVTSEAGDRLGW